LFVLFNLRAALIKNKLHFYCELLARPMRSMERAIDLPPDVRPSVCLSVRPLEYVTFKIPLKNEINAEIRSRYIL